MRHLEQPSDHPDLLVGTENGDDAAVWRRPDGRALVATADFFTPIVDDPRTWGRIAAANAASDVYAMGGTPLFALNLVAWPRDELPLDLLAEVIAGGSDMARQGGWVVAGGHTVDGPEPMYGQAVTGEVDPAQLLTNATAHAGDHLVLTKPLGTGLVATAIKRSAPDAPEIAVTSAAAVTEMTRLNDVAARIAVEAGATGATDVTGFGLLGHLHKMALASGVAAEIDAPAVPLLPGVIGLLDAGFVPGGTIRNLDHVEPALEGSDDQRTRVVLADAQTSGGLLFGCPTDLVDDVVERLTATGHTAARIGRLLAGVPGAIEVRGVVVPDEGPGPA